MSLRSIPNPSVESRSTFSQCGLHLLLLCLMPTVTLAQPEAEVHGTYEGDPMYSVLPPNQIPAIMTPRFVSGEEAQAQMSPAEPILGVTIDGKARAYSLWQLDSHELVNDTLSGVAIAAVW
jgi:hypothetical protein